LSQNQTEDVKVSEQRAQPTLALDLVEMGTDAQLVSGKTEKSQRSALPEGITSKMLSRDVIRIAWPSMAELILTQLSSMVDLMMVGQISPGALNAVGLATQPKFLVMTMFMAMNVGATAMVARHKGAGQQAKANLILRQAILLTFILSSIAAVIGYIYASPLIALMGATDAESLAGGEIYFKIQMVGVPFLALTSTITATLRGVGNSKTAMYYNVVSNVVNVIFNYFWLSGPFGFPRMEVAGASLATILGQTVAFVLAMIAVMGKKNYIRLVFREGFMPAWEAIASIVKIGLPSMLEQIIMRAGVIIYTRMVTGLGVIAFATHQICMNIQAFSFMNGQAFAVSATSLTGQSLGKKRVDMAEAYTRRTRRIGLLVSLFIAAISFFFGGELVKLYQSDPEIVATGAKLMMLVALVQPLQSSQFILSGALRGAGDTKAIAVITFITILLVRPGIAYIMIYGAKIGIFGAWVALVADQALRSAFVMLRYNSGKWKNIRI
jgi:putative MATE family efflux protein